MTELLNYNPHRQKLPQTVLFAAVFAVLIAAFLVSVCVGQYPIQLSEIGEILGGGLQGSMTRRVFFTLRLPRTVMALMAGVGLGTAGNIYQTIFKNPLASPDIIGVAPGANLGAAVSIVLLGSSTVSIAAGAFAGGIAVVLLVMLLVRITPTSTTATYVLSGIVMSSISKAFIMLLKVFADPESELAAIEFWTMGSLANITDVKVRAIAPIFVISLTMLFLLHRQIDMMSLSEDECRALGMRLSEIRILVLALSTLLVASIISLTGLISFIGLVAPHIARMMLSRNNCFATVMSALVGGAVLLLSDTLARCLYSAELPISIPTTLIGIPVLVWFMCRKKEARA